MACEESITVHLMIAGFTQRTAVRYAERHGVWLKAQGTGLSALRLIHGDVPFLPRNKSSLYIPHSLQPTLYLCLPMSLLHENRKIPLSNYLIVRVS